MIQSLQLMGHESWPYDLWVVVSWNLRIESIIELDLVFLYDESNHLEDELIDYYPENFWILMVP